MSKAATFLRLALVMVTLTVVVDLFFKPTVFANPFWDFLVALISQAVAIFASYMISQGRKRVIVRTVLVGFLYSFVVVYLLMPENDIGFAWTFIAVTIIEVSGFITSEVLVRQGRPRRL